MKLTGFGSDEPSDPKNGQLGINQGKSAIGWQFRLRASTAQVSHALFSSSLHLPSALSPAWTKCLPLSPSLDQVVKPLYSCLQVSGVVLRYPRLLTHMRGCMPAGVSNPPNKKTKDGSPCAAAAASAPQNRNPAGLNSAQKQAEQKLHTST